MSSIYRVEKKEQPVVLFQSDGSVMKGVVFLSPSAYSHIGQQTLMDLLQEKEVFFPFKLEDGTFCVANKATITHIRYQPEPRDTNLEGLGDQVDIQITFVGGEQLCGAIRVEMPEDRNRLFDFINTAGQFFTLATQEANYLVNIAQIREVCPKS